MPARWTQCSTAALVKPVSKLHFQSNHEGEDESPPFLFAETSRIALNSRMSFELHPRLAAGTVQLGQLPGGHVLLKNNSLFSWLLLVPEVEEGIEDLHQLDADLFHDLSSSILTVSKFVEEHFRPEKLNVACIGNQVSQMHIHIVGRSHDDPAWPGVVWSHDGKQPYTDEQVASIRSAWNEFSKSS